MLLAQLARAHPGARMLALSTSHLRPPHQQPPACTTDPGALGIARQGLEVQVPTLPRHQQPCPRCCKPVPLPVPQKWHSMPSPTGKHHPTWAQVHSRGRYGEVTKGTSSPLRKAGMLATATVTLSKIQVVSTSATSVLSVWCVLLVSSFGFQLECSTESPAGSSAELAVCAGVVHLRE